MKENKFKQTEIGEIPEEWSIMELGKLCEVKSGKRLPAGHTLLNSKTAHPYIRIRDLQQMSINTSNLLYLSNSTYDNISKYIITKDDVYISIVASIGLVGLVPESISGANLTENCARLTNLKGIQKEYLAFYLNTQRGQEQIKSLTVGTTQAKLALHRIKQIKIPLPPMDEQEKISKMIYSINKKLELSYQMNKILESIAQAIFKRWFVDFKFPGYEKVKFVDDLPVGWEIQTIGNVLELAYGKALKDDIRQIGNIPVYGSNGQIGWHSEKLVGGPGIVVGRKGNPGIVTWAPTDFFPIDTSFYVVIKKLGVSMYYIFHALQNINLASLGADSAVPGLNRNIAYNTEILVPSGKVIKQFDDFVKPIFDLAFRNYQEINKLFLIRDSLLPKLMSGKMRVK